MTEPHRVIELLVGVYNAEGSLRGELAYAWGRLTGRTHCGLCDVTHAGLRRRPAFVSWAQSLPVPFELVHLDERSADVTAASAGQAPCVLARTAEGWQRVLDADAIEACSGQLDCFTDTLDRALAAHGLRWPPTD